MKNLILESIANRYGDWMEIARMPKETNGKNYAVRGNEGGKQIGRVFKTEAQAKACYALSVQNYFAEKGGIV
jgi:hypothetical protein